MYLTCTCTSTWTLHLHVHKHVDVHPHVPYIYIHIYIYVHNHLHLRYITPTFVSTYTPPRKWHYIYNSIYMYINMYIYMYMYVYMCIYVCLTHEIILVSFSSFVAACRLWRRAGLGEITRPLRSVRWWRQHVPHHFRSVHARQADVWLQSRAASAARSVRRQRHRASAEHQQTRWVTSTSPSCSQATTG